MLSWISYIYTFNEVIKAAGDLRKWRFHHVLMTELSLLSFLSASKVTELSLLHMFLGQKWAWWQFFVCHFKSAQWILFIFAVELIHVIVLILKRKNQSPLNYKLAETPMFLESDTSVTFVISDTQNFTQNCQKWQFCHLGYWIVKEIHFSRTDSFGMMR